MAWPTLRTFKDAAASTRQAIIGTTATVGEDVPLYNPVRGVDGADPQRIGEYIGLPVRVEKLSGGPTTYPAVRITSASSTTTTNNVAIGGSGGSAVPGVFEVSAHPDNAGVLAIGDTSANAAAGLDGSSIPYWKGTPLWPGQTRLIATDDLRAWKAAARTAGDSIVVLRVAA